jgi:glycosyltransferase involved in cell wall biosynthesis
MKEMDYLVDINVAVYNQASFLKQTLDSILAQKTNFNFRLLVGDDCSTDGSMDILKEYEQKYKNVNVIYQPINLGIGKGESNGKVILKKSTAKYLALTDGDDYWTDPLKLQKQVNFLENNPSYAITHHRVNLLRDNEIKPDYLNYRTPGTTTISDLAQGNYIRLLSGVFRNFFIDPAFKFSIGEVTGDYYLFMIMASRGKIKYFPEVMGVYRMHHGGIWSHNNSPAMWETWMNNLNKLCVLFDSDTNARLRKQNCQIIQKLITIYQDVGQLDAAVLMENRLAELRLTIPEYIMREKKREHFTLKEKVKKIFGYDVK